MHKRTLATLFLLALLALAGCLPGSTPKPTLTPKPGEPPTAVAPQPTSQSARTVTVMTHDSFSISEAVVEAFQTQCDCTIRFLKSGDTGLALNKAILSKDNPLADVFYGVDNSFLSRALAGQIFEPYASPLLAGIPDALKLDPTHQLLPVDYGYVNLNYDKVFFADNGIPVPQNLLDLIDPAYEGMLAVENPATSSPGLAFLLTTIAVFGETGDYTYLDFWRDLRANDVFVADGWEDAYYGQFSGGSGEGDHPLVVSYATSPAAEVFFADPQPADSPTGNILIPGESFRQIEFVGILRGAAEPELARAWVDFMLGETFQADIPLQMWVYPARTGVALPEIFTDFAQAPDLPAEINADRIEAGREGWLQAWTDVVLR